MRHGLGYRLPWATTGCHGCHSVSPLPAVTLPHYSAPIPPLLYRDVRSFDFLAREMGDPVVQQAPDAFQKFDARVAKVVPRHVRPAALDQRPHGGTEKAARLVLRVFGPGSGFVFHISSPSFRRSESYSLTWRGSEK